MILAGATALFLLAVAGADQASSPPSQGGSITVRHQIIVRVPAGPRRAPLGGPAIDWREGRGPRCIASRQVIGATLLGQNSVDLILRDRRRVRARLERRCPALDYYRGFYIEATEDGQICAERDSIRSRAGGECQIETFRSLYPGR